MIDRYLDDEAIKAYRDAHARGLLRVGREGEGPGSKAAADAARAAKAADVAARAAKEAEKTAKARPGQGGLAGRRPGPRVRSTPRPILRARTDESPSDRRQHARGATQCHNGVRRDPPPTSRLPPRFAVKTSTNGSWSSPARELDRLGRFQGFSAEAERYLRLCSSPSSWSTDRGRRSRTTRASSRSSPTSSSGQATACSATPGVSPRARRGSTGCGRWAWGATCPKPMPEVGDAGCLRDGDEARARRGGRDRSPGRSTASG